MTALVCVPKRNNFRHWALKICHRKPWIYLEKFSLSESSRGNCKAEKFLAFINGQDKKKLNPSVERKVDGKVWEIALHLRQYFSFPVLVPVKDAKHLTLSMSSEKNREWKMKIVQEKCSKNIKRQLGNEW